MKFWRTHTHEISNSHCWRPRIRSYISLIHFYSISDAMSLSNSILIPHAHSKCNHVYDLFFPNTNLSLTMLNKWEISGVVQSWRGNMFMHGHHHMKFIISTFHRFISFIPFVLVGWGKKIEEQGWKWWFCNLHIPQTPHPSTPTPSHTQKKKKREKRLKMIPTYLDSWLTIIIELLLLL